MSRASTRWSQLALATSLASVMLCPDALATAMFSVTSGADVRIGAATNASDAVTDAVASVSEPPLVVISEAAIVLEQVFSTSGGTASLGGQAQGTPSGVQQMSHVIGSTFDPGGAFAAHGTFGFIDIFNFSADAFVLELEIDYILNVNVFDNEAGGFANAQAYMAVSTLFNGVFEEEITLDTTFDVAGDVAGSNVSRALGDGSMTGLLSDRMTFELFIAPGLPGGALRESVEIVTFVVGSAVVAEPPTVALLGLALVASAVWFGVPRARRSPRPFLPDLDAGCPRLGA